MKKGVLFAIVLSMFVSVQAQGVKSAGLKKAEIFDPGQLYSTYKMDDSEIGVIRSALSNDEAKVLEVITYAHETAWPAGLNTLEGRLNRQEIIRNFKAFKVADLGNKFLLLIPAKKNKSVGDIQLAHDIFMIVGKSGVN